MAHYGKAVTVAAVVGSVPHTYLKIVKTEPTISINVKHYFVALSMRKDNEEVLSRE